MSAGATAQQSTEVTIRTDRGQGLTLRGAALTVGFCMLIMTGAAPFAEFFVLHRLIVPGNIEQTSQNIVAHEGLFLAGIFALLINYILDVIIAWGLFFLLVPVSRPLGALAACFRLVYTAIGLFSLLHLVTAFRLLHTADFLTAFGSDQLHAQTKLLLNSFRSDWSIGLILFGIHLLLIGYLVYRSGFLPKIIGLLLIINGSAWVINNLQPYFFPHAHLEFLSVTYFGELVFMLWLLIKGWKLQGPA